MNTLDMVKAIENNLLDMNNIINVLLAFIECGDELEELYDFTNFLLGEEEDNENVVNACILIQALLEKHGIGEQQSMYLH